MKLVRGKKEAFIEILGPRNPNYSQKESVNQNGMVSQIFVECGITMDYLVFSNALLFRSILLYSVKQVLL